MIEDAAIGGRDVFYSDRDVVMDVRAALAALPPQERACVVLRFYDDLTVPQIAAQLRLAEGTVKRYLSDASGKLTRTLGEDVDAPDRDDGGTGSAGDEGSTIMSAMSERLGAVLEDDRRVSGGTICGRSLGSVRGSVMRRRAARAAGVGSVSLVGASALAVGAITCHGARSSWARLPPARPRLSAPPRRPTPVAPTSGAADAGTIS